MQISNSEYALRSVPLTPFQLTDKILPGHVSKQGTVQPISMLKTFITNVSVFPTVPTPELTILTITCLLTILAKNVSSNVQPDTTATSLHKAIMVSVLQFALLLPTEP